MQNRLSVAVIGVGHLGKEHARILGSMPDVELVGVVDPNHVQADAVAARTGTMAYSSARPLIGRIQAAVIATPTAYHHDSACELLANGISLLVEKPLTSNVARGIDLVSLAEKHDAILQVGHIERFNPAYEELRRRPLIPQYIRCERHGGFTGRSMDVGVVFDVMIHDLDLILDLVGTASRSSGGNGGCCFGRERRHGSGSCLFRGRLYRRPHGLPSQPGTCTFDACLGRRRLRQC
jgi:predicted dehydrogenase